MKKLIGYLMHLANGEGLRDEWYPLKTTLCDRYGISDGYDVQYIEGKRCNACDGTGIFIKHSFSGSYKEPCFRCIGGWYKKPMYNILERINVAGYIFHKPFKQCNFFMNPVYIPPTVIIRGYVTHSKKKFGWLAYSLLYMIYDMPGYKKRIFSYGRGWLCSWWLPKNWLYNFMHIKKHGKDSIPLRKIRNLWTKNKCNSDDLPF